LGSSGGGSSPSQSPVVSRGLGASAVDGEKKKLEADRKAFEEEKGRFEDEKKRKDAEIKAALAAAEKALAAAKENQAAKEREAAKEKEAATPAPVTLTSSEQLICDAFSALLHEAQKKDLALKKAGLAK